MVDRARLIRRMKEIRTQLNALVAGGRPLTSEEVLALSQQLDEIVVAYQRQLLARAPSRRKVSQPPPVRSIRSLPKAW